jgi:5-(carboxyamino)imidazole ribonucleotide mutase
MAETVDVGILMGSRNDWEAMKAAADVLAEFGVPHEVRVISAHRTPDAAIAYAESAEPRGLRAIIAGAGMAAHLAGVLAAKTPVPVLGVPMQSKALQGLDSLLSTVQMPKGVPVATFAIGSAGAANAALFAVAMLANDRPELRKRLIAFRQRQTQDTLDKPDPRV